MAVVGIAFHKDSVVLAALDRAHWVPTNSIESASAATDEVALRTPPLASSLSKMVCLREWSACDDHLVRICSSRWSSATVMITK